MIELGKPIDDALDIHNEVERLVNPEERIKQLKHLIPIEPDLFDQRYLQKELDLLLKLPNYGSSRRMR